MRELNNRRNPVLIQTETLKSIVAILLTAVIAISCASVEEKTSTAVVTGDRLLAEGKCGEATEQFSKAATLSPDSADIHLKLARAHARCGNEMAAIKEYRTAISCGACEVDVSREVVPLLIALGEYKGAESLLKKIISADPADSVAHNNMGAVLYRQKKYKDARAAFEKAIAVNPSHSDSYLNLAVLLENEMGDLSKANENYKRYLSLNPNSPQADQIKDHIVQNELRLLERGTSAPGFDEQMEQGKKCLAEGRFAEAEAAFRGALRSRKTSASATANLGVALMEQGRLDEAETTLKKCIKLDGGTAECAYQLGWVYKLEGNEKKAVEMWQEALRIDPSYENARRALKTCGK